MQYFWWNVNNNTIGIFITNFLDEINRNIRQVNMQQIFYIRKSRIKVQRKNSFCSIDAIL